MDPDYTYGKEPSAQWFEQEIKDFLLWAAERKVSDVKIKPEEPIWVRLHGKWQKATSRDLSIYEINTLIDQMTRDGGASAQLQSGEPIDFGYEIKVDRFTNRGFRGHASPCKAPGGVGTEITLRINPSLPPTVKELGLDPEFVKAAMPKNGLVIFCGTMGTGKSTSIAAILREIIENQPRSVSTYEDPIEFDFMKIPNRMGPVCQAEIPIHLRGGFEASSRNAARRATDVILYGEARDLKTMKGMIESAEIGAAAYATVHTTSVAATPSRIINKFPDNVQNLIATTLLSNLRLVVQQRLFDKVGGGRIAVREILKFEEQDRLELIKIPIDQLVGAIESLVHEKGTPLLRDVEAKYKEGLIFEKDYLAVKREKEILRVA